MTAKPAPRAPLLDPDRWRTRADGPRWLYAEPGRLRAIWRLLVFGLALAVFQPIADSFLAPLMSGIARALGERIEAYPWITLVSILAALTLALRTVDGAPWRSVGLGDGAWRPRALATGAWVGAAAILITFALLWLSGSARVVPVPVGDLQWSASSWQGTALRLAVLLAPAALWEELLFRGYLWTVADDAAGPRVALWATAVAFGVVHLLNPGAGVLSTTLVTVAGLCLGVLRERTGSLAAVWVAHFVWNWIMAAALHVPVSGVPFDTPGYRTVVTGASWWTGGAWGPEGGAAALLVMGGALAMSMRPALWKSNAGQLRTENSSR